MLLPPDGETAEVRALYVEPESDLSRSNRSIHPGSSASFLTYFNGFPASYWARWTRLRRLQLRLELDGSGELQVYRSTANGAAVRVHAAPVAGLTCVEVPLGLTGFADGGWYWFELTADHRGDGLRLRSGGWHADGDPAPGARLAVGIPTFNRPTDCVATLRALAGDERVRSALTAVIVPDMGEAKVRDQPGFAAAAELLGDRLLVLDQPNLGGSGGFARILDEALHGTDCDYVLFMDDDVIVEPEVIMRALAFARYADGRVLVGGQMLNIPDRSTLHAMGEVFNHRVFGWEAAPGTQPQHDLAREPLRTTPWLHRRVDVDYNAWWMCLIPRAAADRLGLPLPLFIKWDDCEYGLRAGAAGYPTVTLPGVGVWHMSFADKDDQSDWRGYFLIRNRLVVAALHAGTDRPWRLIAELVRHAFGRLLLLEYSSVALQHKAIDDFLAGPEALRASLPTVLGAVRAVQAEQQQRRTRPVDPAGLPPPPPRRLRQTSRIDLSRRALAFGRTIIHNFRPLRSPADPQTVPHVGTDVHWYEISGADAFIVSGAGGQPVLRRRDPATFRAMLLDTVRQHARLARRFATTRRRFIVASGYLTSARSWRGLF